MSSFTRITLLGATGSIGRSTLDVIAQHPDRFRVCAVVGGSDAEALAKVAKAVRADFAALAAPAAHKALATALAGSGIAHGAGQQAVIEAVDRDCDIVVAAIVGTAGLAPTHAALKAGRRIALANKESLVSAGVSFMRDAKAKGVTVLPMDSEHNALAQALGGNPPEAVERMTITASGGPFRTWTADAIARATREDALVHPTYSMGAKITIDSATLMNKGLELIEAHHLFGLGSEKLHVVVHPQSIVHGLVSFWDGAVTACLALPDMRVPISHCLGLGDRLKLAVRRLDLASIAALTFEPPDLARFPALKLAQSVLSAGGALPTVLNAANEIAVGAFLNRRISFTAITEIVGRVCDEFSGKRLQAPDSVAEALSVDEEARRAAEDVLPRVTMAAS
jgi:1-deoxy-D-xylulose-5-phosphate reductoisomerase